VFVLWAAFFCLWTFSTLIALIARASPHEGFTVDPEQIAAIALYVSSSLSFPFSHLTENRRSGLFSLFTVIMFSTHFVLISTNQTTLEHFNARTTKDREQLVLDEMHSTCAFRCVTVVFLSPRVLEC
jgi:palmitoyltransferase